jgi:cob(I)alamin adenosyltransferase
LLPTQAVERLENTIDEWNSELPALKEFILPGGSPAAAHCHLARAVCRRAERIVVELANTDDLNDSLRRYVNRLSDLLFVLARKLARHDGGNEVLWDRSRLKA